jgi:hypothetical protein
MNPDSQQTGMSVDSALPVTTQWSDEGEDASFQIK